jgi:hypothetical protein
VLILIQDASQEMTAGGPVEGSCTPTRLCLACGHPQNSTSAACLEMDGAQISALMAIKDDPVKCVLLKADGSLEEVRAHRSRSVTHRTGV